MGKNITAVHPFCVVYIFFIAASNALSVIFARKAASFMLRTPSRTSPVSANRIPSVLPSALPSSLLSCIMSSIVLCLL